MRIIGGEFRSRRLLTPKDASTTRPIPDRVKESLFSLLRGHTDGAVVFDAFAGTGAIGLEAISRGASRCIFVERERPIVEILRANIAALGVDDRCEVVSGDALGPGALARCPDPVNLVFMDPPYPIARDPLGWKRIRLQLERLIARLTDDGFAILRTPSPLLIEKPAEPGAAPSPDERRRHPRKGKPRRRDDADEDQPRTNRSRDDRRDMRPHDDLDADPDEADEQPPAPGIIRTPADLTIPGALGPETHIYHGMAVHLYARKPAG